MGEKKWDGSGVDGSKLLASIQISSRGQGRAEGREKRPCRQFGILSCYSVFQTENLLPYVVSSAQVQPNRGRPCQEKVGGGGLPQLLLCMLH